MNVRNRIVYQNEISDILDVNYQWEKLRNRTILVTGATGSIGQVIIDVLMRLNLVNSYKCNIMAVSRSAVKAEKMFRDYWNNEYFKFFSMNVSEAVNIDEKIDYILHAASNTHPLQYAQDPIGTITTNVFGTYHLLSLAYKNNSEFLLFSSVEIYGENNMGIEMFDEKDMGYLDCATLRAGYPESKRLAESMCYAFARQLGIKFKIARLARVYGLTMTSQDSKAIAQFLKNGLNHQNIILKSEGNQLYSYVYVMDCVSGILAVLLNGANGEVYNISGTDSAIVLKDLAQMIAEEFNVSVVHELPTQIEKEGFSKATKAVLKNEKLISLGWSEKTNIKEGVRKIRNASKKSCY